jgi:hypothetical protein
MDKLIRDKSRDTYDQRKDQSKAQGKAQTGSRANYNPNCDTLRDWISNNELHAIQSKIQSYRNSDPNRLSSEGPAQLRRNKNFDPAQYALDREINAGVSFLKNDLQFRYSKLKDDHFAL